MKKLLPLFTACVACAAVACLAFANNCVVIFRWWKAFLAAGGDTAVMSEEISGFLPWLDWSAVDYSAVTTFIPALGLSCMALSVWRLMRGVRVRGEDFPFFRGSDQLNVALGLFGTLWGIIVIGYFKLDTVTMADLMQCLHTALFSTLMAVVWVFMIDRPLVRPFFLRLLDGTGLAETDGGDLADAVGRLVVRLGEASDAFDRRQAGFEKAFRSRQKDFERTFRERQAALESAAKRRDAEFGAKLEKRLKEAGEALAAQLKRSEDAAVSRQKAADEALAKRQKSADEAFASRQGEQDAAFKRRMADLDAFCQGRLAAYEREFEARQKEYAELFRRRIDELQALAGESKARADAADARLAAVTNALRG